MNKQQLRSLLVSALALLDKEDEKESKLIARAIETAETGVKVKIQTEPFAVQEGRGRRQEYPILQIKPFDLSESNRTLAFRAILKELDIPDTTKIIKHPKISGAFVIQNSKHRTNFVASITLPKKGKK